MPRETFFKWGQLFPCERGCPWHRDFKGGVIFVFDCLGNGNYRNLNIHIIMKLSKQQIKAACQKENRVPTDEEFDILSRSEFVLEPGNFQIKDHSDDVKKKQTDPTKDYPIYWIDAKVAVKIDDTTPKDDEGNYLVSLRGSVFKKAKDSNLPDFVTETGTITDVNLKPTNGTSKKTSDEAPF